MIATKPPAELFWRHVDRCGPDDCWLWHGAHTGNGYGRFDTDGHYLAHRFSYELHKGPIPYGLVIDHLCRVRNCVNPAHLEAVTQRENIIRGELGKEREKSTHCGNGHEYTSENTYWHQRKGKRGRFRTCIACLRQRTREYRAAAKARA